MCGKLKTFSTHLNKHTVTERNTTRSCLWDKLCGVNFENLYICGCDCSYNRVLVIIMIINHRVEGKEKKLNKIINKFYID